MKRWLAISLLIIPVAVVAQEETGFFGRLFGGTDDSAASEDDGGGFLERQLEGLLSQAGREVQITGFEGALSSRATMQRLTIADEDGVWLTLNDVVLDWTRSALLRRRIEINELSAAEIVMPRLPLPGEPAVEAPSPEAKGFSLPELPVAIQIGTLDAARVDLGQPILRQAAVFTLNGSVALADGAGSADITAERIDGAEGALALDAAYDNESRELTLDLDLSEGTGGIVSNLAGLPGRPSLELTVAGGGPLSDFAADLGFSTDGQERLAGSVRLGTAEAGGTRFNADLGGDVAPVFMPQYRDFFGPEISLRVAGIALPEGGTRVDSLSLLANAVQLDGTASIGADGLPERIALTGRVADAGGGPVLLPVTGGATRVQDVSLNANFDESVGEQWTLDLIVNGLDRPGLRAERIGLTGSGLIISEPARSVTADLDFTATELDLADGGAQAALGEEVTGRAVLSWKDGEPLEITDLTIDGETYGAEAAGRITLGEAFDISGEATLSAHDLSAFAGLAKRPLSGSAALSVIGNGNPLGGNFEASIAGTTRDLTAGITRLDPLLGGDGRLTLRANRGPNGIRVEALDIDLPDLNVQGHGRLATGESQIDLTAKVTDTALVAEGMSGPANVVLSATEDAAGWAFTADADGAGARIVTSGTVQGLGTDPVVAATFEGDVADLGVFRDLTGRGLAGSVAISGTGRMSFDLLNATIDAEVSANGVRTGDARIDDLLNGRVEARIDAVRAGDSVTINALDLNAPDAKVTAAGRIDDLTGKPVFDGEVEVSSPDLLPFSGIAGRRVAGSVEAHAKGLVAADLSQLDLDLNATTTNLDAGVFGSAEAMAGRTTLTLAARREGDRIEIAGLDLTNPQIALSGRGMASGLGGAPAFDGQIQLNADDIAVFSGLAKRDLSGAINGAFDGIVSTDLSEVDARLTVRSRDLDLGLPGPPIFPGQGSIDVAAKRDGDVITLTQLAVDNANVAVSGGGQIGNLNQTPVFDGRLSLSVASIEPFGGFAARPLSGSLKADVEGDVALDLSTLDLTGNAEGRNIRVGQSDVDRLLNGTTTIAVDVTRANENTTIRRAEVDASGFDVRASGTLGDAGRDVDLWVRLADIGPYAPNFSGPVTLEGTASEAEGVVTLNLNGEGPGGIVADASGTVDVTGPTFNMTVNATAPLAVANRFIQPRTLSGNARLQMRVDGPPALSSLSGTVSTNDARLVAPLFSIILDNIDATARIGSNRLAVDVGGNVQAGGNLRLGGTIDLGASLSSDLDVALNGVVLRDPDLYTTSVTGNIAINGPLRGGGGRISGDIALGETEIRVPSTGAGSGGKIPEINHVNEPEQVRATRARAGLLRKSMDGTGTLQERRRNSFDLNLALRAPNRIFVRGRGLDAELGGGLQLGGTTLGIVPSGQFELNRGRLDILGKRLTLNEGSIRLEGEFIPMIRLVAETDTGDVTVMVIVEGLLTEPEINFMSLPELPEDEVLARLLFGRSIQDISPLQAAQLASAVATLTGRGPNFGAGIRSNIGLDDLDFTTNAEGVTALRAGKYITEKIYTDVNVGGEGETRLNLNFDMTDSLSIKGGINNEGDTSLGIFYQKDY